MRTQLYVLVLVVVVAALFPHLSTQEVDDGDGRLRMLSEMNNIQDADDDFTRVDDDDDDEDSSDDHVAISRDGDNGDLDDAILDRVSRLHEVSKVTGRSPSVLLTVGRTLGKCALQTAGDRIKTKLASKKPLFSGRRRRRRRRRSWGKK